MISPWSFNSEGQWGLQLPLQSLGFCSVCVRLIERKAFIEFTHCEHFRLYVAANLLA